MDLVAVQDGAVLTGSASASSVTLVRTVYSRSVLLRKLRWQLPRATRTTVATCVAVGTLAARTEPALRARHRAMANNASTGQSPRVEQRMSNRLAIASNAAEISSREGVLLPAP